jgi:hypothetical protein
MATHPLLTNNGLDIAPPGAWDDIADNVTGTGMWAIGAGATLDFLYGVSSGQTVQVSNYHPRWGAWGASQLDINDLKDFHAQVNLSYVAPPKGAPAAEQSSVGLQLVGVHFDSYSYAHDMLSLWSGKTVVETLRLAVADQYGITVQCSSGAWTFVSANTPTQDGLALSRSSHLAVHI